MTFGPEQGMSLLVSGNYIKNKFTLLGQRFWRETGDGKILFGSALFNYSLVPLMLLFNYDPVPISAFFVILNLATGLVLYGVALKTFDRQTALWAFLLFAFNSYMIFHSLFIWVLQWAPLVGISVFYILFRYWRAPKRKGAILLGGLVGVGVGLDYFYLTAGLVVFLMIILVAKRKVRDGLWFGVGALAANFPMILFDLRHNWYHTRTLWQYSLETLKHPAQSGIHYYHFLYLWPIAALLGGLLLKKLFTKSPLVAVILVCGYLILNLTSPNVNLDRPMGMERGMNVEKFKKAAALIASDNPRNFNVAALLDFDSRAYPLRYLLQFVNGFTPEGVEEYPGAETLYVFAHAGYDFDQALAWEIKSYRPFVIKNVRSVDRQYSVYKLTRVDLK